jgi:hypothetical protein
MSLWEAAGVSPQTALLAAAAGALRCSRRSWQIVAGLFAGLILSVGLNKVVA